LLITFFVFLPDHPDHQTFLAILTTRLSGHFDHQAFFADHQVFLAILITSLPDHTDCLSAILATGLPGHTGHQTFMAILTTKLSWLS
jgi:hypothetical protein